MFNWNKQNGIEAVQKQFILNIKLNTKTLVSQADRIELIIKEGIKDLSPADKNNLYRVEKDLIDDIMLATSNGLDIKDIEKNIILPVLEEMSPTEKALAMVKTVLEAVHVSIEDRDG